MNQFIDMDLLISLVQNRPVLWDQTAEDYNNKQLTYAAWQEICESLHENYDTLTKMGKHEFGRHVLKKWSNARDNWMRCAKKLIKHESDKEEKPVHKYKFFNQMKFLNKILINQTPSYKPKAEEVEDTHTEEKEESPAPKKKKKKLVREEYEVPRRTSIADSVVKEVRKEDSKGESRIMSFFRSILPTVEKFNDNDLVEFQYDVVKSMRDISQRNMAHVYIQSPSSSSSHDSRSKKVFE